MNTDPVKTIVKEKYGQAAVRARLGIGHANYGDADALGACCDPITSNLYDTLAKEVVSAFVRATKPASSTCCAPGCCA